MSKNLHSTAHIQLSEQQNPNSRPVRIIEKDLNFKNLQLEAC